MYSAIKKNGTRLYELARRGDEVVLESRKVNIKSFEITAINFPIIHFKIACSTGTYIRSIAHDFGKALGCGAYLSSLRRTAIGEQRIEGALTLEAFFKSLSEEPTP
jgi:tRNA pseudouridine55 synthase